MTTTIPLESMSLGETKSIIITVQTPLLADDDITTYTFTWRLWHPLKGKVLEKTVGSGITILMPQSGDTKGQLMVSLVKADTASLAPLTYTQELRMFYGSAEIKVGKGSFQIDPSRTIPATVAP